MDNTRSVKYDIFRILAIAFVIMCHISAFMAIQYPDPASSWFMIGNIPNGISRAGIPLFVMLSGALLLNENRKFNAKHFYAHSFLWLALLLPGWLLFYALFYAAILPGLMGQPIDWAAFGGYILSFKGCDYPHLWYMFMVVGLYAMIPVFRLFVKKENVHYILGIVAVSAAVCFLGRTLDVFTRDSSVTVSSFLNQFHLEPVYGYVGLFLLGWLFDNFKLSRKYRMILYVCALAAFVSSTLLVQFTINDIPEIRDYVYTDCIFPLVYGAGVYVFIDTLCANRTHDSGIIRMLSTCSFGVYIIHVALLEIFTRVILTPEISNMDPVVYFFVQFLLVSGISLVIVYMVSKIGYLKKIFHIK